MASHRSRAAPRAVATATTLLLLTVLLATAHTATALSALEELIVSQYNTTYIGGFGREYTTTNYTIPTNTSLYEVDPETMIQSFSNAVVVDPYLLTQAEVDFFRQQLPYTVLQRESAPYIPVRASQVAGCTAVHSVCCAYYWVTESYPPGLSLDDVDPSLILWNGSATNTSIDFNFTNTFSGVQCNATTTAAIPAIQLRDPKACYVPMLARTVGTDPPQWDFMCPATARAVDRYIQISTAYNSADPTAMALIQKRYGQSLEAGFDPWAYIGASALSGSASYGDSLVQVIHNKTLGYIPVVAPIVVNAVILVATAVFLIITFCQCERKWRDQRDQSLDTESESSELSDVQSTYTRGNVAQDYIDVESVYGAAGPSEVDQVSRYDSVRKGSVRSMASAAAATAPDPTPTPYTALKAKREGHRRSSSGTLSVPQHQQMVPNPLAAHPATASMSTPPPGFGQRTLSQGGGSLGVRNSFRQAPVGPYGQPVAPMYPQTPPPGMPYAPPAVSPPDMYASSVMPFAPFVASPQTVEEAPSYVPNQAPTPSPAGQEGSMSRRGSELRRKNSMVSWKIKDIEM